MNALPAQQFVLSLKELMMPPNAKRMDGMERPPVRNMLYGNFQPIFKYRNIYAFFKCLFFCSDLLPSSFHLIRLHDIDSAMSIKHGRHSEDAI